MQRRVLLRLQESASSSANHAAGKCAADRPATPPITPGSRHGRAAERSILSGGFAPVSKTAKAIIAQNCTFSLCNLRSSVNDDAIHSSLHHRPNHGLLRAW